MLVLHVELKAVCIQHPHANMLAYTIMEQCHHRTHAGYIVYKRMGAGVWNSKRFKRSSFRFGGTRVRRVVPGVLDPFPFWIWRRVWRRNFRQNFGFLRQSLGRRLIIPYIGNLTYQSQQTNRTTPRRNTLAINTPVHDLRHPPDTVSQNIYSREGLQTLRTTHLTVTVIS